MSNLYESDPFKDGSSFFGFMGVTVALVLASIFRFSQISAPHMEQPKPVQESAASPSGDPQSSWSHSSQSSWLVSLVSTEWSLLSSWVKKVIPVLNSVKKDGQYTYHDGYKHMASGLVCGFSCVVCFLFYSGCWLRYRNRRRCRNQSQCSAIKTVCRTHPHLNFRRSLGIVRTYRISHFGFMSLSLYLLFLPIFCR